MWRPSMISAHYLSAWSVRSELHTHFDFRHTQRSPAPRSKIKIMQWKTVRLVCFNISRSVNIFIRSWASVEILWQSESRNGRILQELLRFYSFYFFPTLVPPRVFDMVGWIWIGSWSYSTPGGIMEETGKFPNRTKYTYSFQSLNWFSKISRR